MTCDLEPPRYNASDEHACEEGKMTFLGALQARRDATTQRSDESPQKWTLLLFGQAIALGAASMNAASYTLEYNLGVVVPIFLMCITYLLLFTHLWYLRKEQEVKEDERTHRLPFSSLRLNVPWWIYLGISTLDVVPNYMTLLSFRYTTLTNSTLLGSLMIPATMLASRFIMARTFRLVHFVGVLLCLGGGTMAIWMDIGHTSSEMEPNHPHSYIGDILAIAAAMLYGLGDTIGEYSIKHIDRVEYLGMLGLFGAILSGLSLPLLEGRAVFDLFAHTPTSGLCAVFVVMVWYVVSLIFYYIASSLFYIRGDATLLNLSLQTSNMWAILFTVVAEQDPPRTAFYLAAAMVVTGVFVYELGETGIGSQSTSSLELPGSPQEKDSLNTEQNRRKQYS